MSKREKNQIPIAAKIAVGVMAIILLVVILVALSRMILSAVRLLGSDGGVTVTDPMFREEAVVVTRPPEETEDGGAVSREALDPSLGWTMEEEGPVDQTTEELAIEAMMPED